MEVFGDLATDPIAYWAEVAWDAAAPPDLMEKAWRRAMVAAAGVEGPLWGIVIGPASATLASLRRIGWSWPSWRTFRAETGLLLDMHEVCPIGIRTMAVADARRRM